MAKTMKYLGEKTNKPTRKLDLIPWPASSSLSSIVTLDCKEFTSFCPVTRQPDFGSLRITYRPHRHLVETKSLKLYLWSFRSSKSFNEQVCRRICEDFFKQVKPKMVRVSATFNTRGGISVEALMVKHA